MITITDKSRCCGCSACMSVCPRSCISMKSDGEGFLYPVTDTEQCIDCNACNKICPIINLRDTDKPFEESLFFAVYSNDEAVLLQSSSGGAFTLLSEKFIAEGGVVFGAAWDENIVRHVRIDTIEELSRLRGSKYVQSDVNATFLEVKSLLANGIKVLYSGTPCEIAGLNSFVKKGKELLNTIEVACHGAPSPKALTAYLEDVKSQFAAQTIKINFRSKETGWINYSVKAIQSRKTLFMEDHKDNIFMRGFLHELYSRPSCHDCRFKGNASKADITLADFWGIEEILPDFPRSKGVSLVIVNTEKGCKLWDLAKSGARYCKVDSDCAIRNNRSLLESAEAHPERKYFFHHLGRGRDFVPLVEICLRLRTITKVKLFIKSILKRIIKWS